MTPPASMRITSVSHEMLIQSTYTENTGDLILWRLARYKIGKPFMKAYFRYFLIAAPEEDQDDWYALYCL